MPSPEVLLDTKFPYFGFEISSFMWSSLYHGHQMLDITSFLKEETIIQGINGFWIISTLNPLTISVTSDLAKGVWGNSRCQRRVLQSERKCSVMTRYSMVNYKLTQYVLGVKKSAKLFKGKERDQHKHSFPLLIYNDYLCIYFINAPFIRHHVFTSWRDYWNDVTSKKWRGVVLHFRHPNEHMTQKLL